MARQHNQDRSVRIRIAMGRDDFGVYSAEHGRDLKNGEVVDVPEFFGHQLVTQKRAVFVHDDETENAVPPGQPLAASQVQSRDPIARRTR